MSLFNPPPPPNPQVGQELGQQVATNQQVFNTQAGQASQAGSMVNQNNPYGGVAYTQTGTGPNGTPIYTANVTLDPTQQNLLTALNQTKTTAGTQGGDLLTGANYGSSTPSDVIGNMTQGTTSQILGQETAALEPFFTTSKDQLDTKLRNQGLFPGQPGYDNAMRQLDVNQGTTVSNFLAQAEPQAFQQAVTGYTLPANLATSLAAFGAPTTPNSSFVQTPGLNIQPANLVGATSTEQQAEQAQYAAQQQQYANMMSGLFGIGTNALGALATGGLSLPFTMAMGGAGGGAPGSNLVA